jgi:hypothetical protein
VAEPTGPVDTPEGAVALLRHIWQASDLQAPEVARIYVPERDRTALLTVLGALEDAEAECKRLAQERLQAVQDADQLRLELEHERAEHEKAKRWLHAAEDELSRRPTRG